MQGGDREETDPRLAPWLHVHDSILPSFPSLFEQEQCSPDI